ncbi:MAG: acyltransferase family protein [Lachnospiraceae bacterium]|nr:acyltransferase family protein [Lachnospiraceae bacterium]
MSRDNRLPYLDAAKGAGILLVVLGHIWEAESPATVLIYSFHVPLFFLISGILMAHTQIEKRSWKEILPAKTRGLVVPYLFFESAFVFIFGIRNHFDFGSEHVYDGLLLQPLNVPLWFLGIMFAAELFLIFLLKTVKNRWVIAAVSLILYVIPLAAGNPGKCGGMGVLLRWCSSVGFLVLGYYISGFVKKTDVPFYILVPAALADVVLALVNGKTGIYKLTFHNPVLFTICGVLGSCLVIFLLKKIRMRSMEFLGRHTLTILGLHIIVLRVLQEILGLHTDGYAGGIAALAIICGILTLADCFLERFLPFAVGKQRKISRKAVDR